MKDRKADNANLETRKTFFFFLGLVLTLGIVYGAFELKFYERSLMDLGQLDLDIDDEEVIMTQREPTPPPPPPPAPPEVINIVENEVEIEEVEFESTETDQTDEIVFVEKVEEETDEIFNFAVVENRPVYPGCEKFATEDEKWECLNKNIMTHIAKNFKFPEMARQMGISGRVFVNFVIEKDGSISNVTVARGVDKLLDDEAIRVVKTLPKFQPAKQRGKAVRMQYTVPINAKLQ